MCGLFGYDSSFAKQPDDEYVEKHRGKQAKMPMKVRVLKEDFWTTAELIAQSRDFENLVNPGGPNDARIELIGPKDWKSMLQHMYNKNYQSFSEWTWQPQETIKAA